MKLLVAVVLLAVARNTSAQGNGSACFEGLGCLPLGPPWTSEARPFPPPIAPAETGATLRLYTRATQNGVDIKLAGNFDLKTSAFKGNRSKTIFLCHGIAAASTASYSRQLINAFLNLTDANVFLLDWSRAANRSNYLAAASNARVVGAQLAGFIKFLVNNGSLDVKFVHLIGSDLGAHVLAYCAKLIRGIGRLSALDPAQIGFEGVPAEVRLAKGDAVFTEVIHTSARPFFSALGFGLIQPVGDVDFYINGGVEQAECKTSTRALPSNLKSINDLANFSDSNIFNLVGCAINKTYQYYIESLTSDCIFWGRLVDRDVIEIKSPNILDQIWNFIKNFFDPNNATYESEIIELPVVSLLTTCGPETCLPMNLNTPIFKARGVFNVVTKGVAPYCQNDTERDKRILNEINNNVKAEESSGFNFFTAVNDFF